jgi:uncharacterized protein (TIGR00725 family)
MKIKVGVMGSAADVSSLANTAAVQQQATAFARAVAAKPQLLLLTGATTGIVYLVGKIAHLEGTLHVGISPASSEAEHIDVFKLPTDACDLLIFTGFGLKGRNVVLVRSCDIVVFISGAMGSLNEFTIAHDENKIIGCLRGTGGVADEADYLLQKFSHKNKARVFQSSNAAELLDQCLEAFKASN